VDEETFIDFRHHDRLLFDPGEFHGALRKSMDNVWVRLGLFVGD